MKVFICSFSGFYVAIPMSAVASLTDLTDRQLARRGAAVERDTESPDTYVSLPMLFGLPQEKLRHGIILKNPGDDADDLDTESKIVLLSTEVINTSEIYGEKMHPIPKSLSGTQFSGLFSGIQCDAGATPDAGLVILLDPERLICHVRQEAAE